MCCWTPTRRPASHCRRCRWPTVLALITPRLPETAAGETLEDGMVLALTGYVWEQGVGGVFTRDAVHVTADGAEVLSASPSWQDVRV